MNVNKLFVFFLLCIFASGCSYYSISYTHTLTQPTEGTNPKRMTYNDSIIGAYLHFTWDFSRLVVSVTNNSPGKPIYIIKDKCAMVVGNKSKPLCFISDQHVDQAPVHSPLMIPPYAQYVEEITPIDNIAFYTEKDKYTHVETTQWKTYPLYTVFCNCSKEELELAKRNAIENPIKYVLTYSYEDVQRNLTFELSVDSVRIKEL